MCIPCSVLTFAFILTISSVESFGAFLIAGNSEPTGCACTSTVNWIAKGVVFAFTDVTTFRAVGVGWTRTMTMTPGVPRFANTFARPWMTSNIESRKEKV